MPELPDVEGFRKTLRDCGTGRRIAKVEIRDSGVLRAVTPQRLRRELEGRRLGVPRRHGKWLLSPVGAGLTLVWHFGMTGELLCTSLDDPFERHDRVALTLSGGRQLRYRDQRKLQGIRLADSDAAVERILADLGPDALIVQRDEFVARMAAHRGAVKSVLMDQAVVAGLGNLLSDEILWRARLSPSRPARDLSDAEARTLHTAMRRVLTSSVRAARVPPRRTWLTGHRDDDEPACPRCGGRLRSRRFSGRRSVWCPDCQR
ncbi:Fpg/Nei family DNA glycosylase [Streptomyces sp. NPDC096176]|uniref:Fpg/Nei family DNA glycosylase n=1 Tax=Streptomyces sp. NPDC096176 TaxID=3366079 RepID=UPI003813CC7C